MHLFLTGATGSVGLEFLRAARHDARIARITCLLRGTSHEPTAQRWQHMLTAHALARASGLQLDFIEGELTAENFGMSEVLLRELGESVTHILHSAAHIRFDAQYADAHHVNVVGTQRVIEFAQRCSRLQHFGHVSTLYVVGTRQGVLPEDAAPEGSFNNAYEQTKYEAELLLRETGLSFDIYRLALLQGRAEDGYVHHYLESHMLMDAFCRGACPKIPGAAEASLDMLPTDYTARALLQLITTQAPSGRIWSIAAGSDAPSIAQLYEAISASVAAIGKPVPPAPAYIDQATLREILASDDPYEHGMSPGACAILEIVAGYLLRPKIYTPSRIPGMAPPPPAAQWLQPVLAHCLQTGWGRRRAVVPA